MDEIIRQWNKERKDCRNCRAKHQIVTESISKCTIKIQNHSVRQRNMALWQHWVAIIKILGVIVNYFSQNETPTL